MDTTVEQPPDAAAPASEKIAKVYRCNGTVATDEVAVTPHDFRRTAALSQSALRQVELVQQKFVEHLSTRLSTFLRMECGAKLTKFETPTYHDFVQSISEPAEVTILEVAPLPGIGILNLSGALCHSMIDRLLGGRGFVANAERSLSEIELALFDEIVQVIMEEWCQHWRADAKLRPVSIGHETTTRFLKTSPPDTIILSALISVQLGECEGQLQLGIPFSMVENIVKENEERAVLRGTEAPPKKAQWRASYNEISVPVIAQWKVKEMRVREVVSLCPGDILPMDPNLIARTHVQLANAREFVGLVGIQNGQVAVQLTKHLALE